MWSRISYYNSRIVGQSFRLGWLEGETHCPKKSLSSTRPYGGLRQPYGGRRPTEMGQKAPLPRGPKTRTVTGGPKASLYGGHRPPYANLMGVKCPPECSNTRRRQASSADIGNCGGSIKHRKLQIDFFIKRLRVRLVIIQRQ